MYVHHSPFFLVDLGGCFITPLGAGRLLAWQVVTFWGGGGGGGGLFIHHEKFISAMHFTQTKVLDFFTYSGQGSGAGGQGGGLFHWSTPGYTFKGVVVGAAKSNYWIFARIFKYPY